MTAAQLLTDDRQTDRRPALWLRFAPLAAAAVLAAPAQALPWPPCSAPGLFPPVAQAQQAPAYPESARQAGAEGFVDVAFVVLRDGRVGWTRVVKAEPSGFFEAAALEQVRDWRYRPALADGVPVECAIQTRLRFTLTDAVAARLTSASSAPAAADDHPAPVYPDQARIEGLEGYVEVAFDVSPAGAVLRADVTTAMPRGDFERASLAAVRRWRFPPQQGEMRSLTRRFDFSLPGSYPHDPAPTLLAAAPLPPEACERRIPGRVKLEVETDAAGRIYDARVLEATPPGLFDETALAVARNSRMAPAYRGGVGVAATALLTLSFEPDDAHCGSSRREDGGRGPSRGTPTPKVSAAGRQ